LAAVRGQLRDFAERLSDAELLATWHRATITAKP
jgi:hypothetical protein